MTRQIIVDRSPGTLLVSKLSALEWFQAGVKLHRQGLYGEATQVLRNAIRPQKDYADAYHLLGICYFLDGWLEFAELNFHQLLMLDPEHLEALLFLSEIYRERGDINSAINALHRALDEDPDYELAFTMLEKAYKLLQLKSKTKKENHNE